MAVNRFSLYQMEQFKKERNKKLMESATKSVEECGFSSKQIKKMMKKKGREKEEEETKECGCGPMKKGKKLSKKEKAPGMRPEPKDKAVVHNMESDGNGILKAKKLFMGVTKKGKGKKGMFDMKGSNKATKKNSKMHKMSESELMEMQAFSKRKKFKRPAEDNKQIIPERKPTENPTKATPATNVASSDKQKSSNSKRPKKYAKKPGLNRKLFRVRQKESDTPVKATKVVISESKKSVNDIRQQTENVRNRLLGRDAIKNVKAGKAKYSDKQIAAADKKANRAGSSALAQRGMFAPNIMHHERDKKVGTLKGPKKQKRFSIKKNIKQQIKSDEKIQKKHGLTDDNLGIGGVGQRVKKSVK